MNRQESLLATGTLQTIYARIRILRLWAIPTLIGTVVLSFLMANGKSTDYSQTAVALVAVLLIGTAIFPLNDVWDLEADRMTHPNRPLVKGELSPDQARIQAHFMIAVGVAISFLLGPVGFAVSLLCATTVLVYSPIKSRYGLAGNVLTATLCSVVLACGVVANPPTERFLTLVLYGAVSALLIFSREIVKDIQDMNADQGFGKQTLPIEYGVACAYQVSALSLIGAGLIVSAVGLVAFDPISAAPAALGLTYFVLGRKLWSSKELEAGHRATQLKWILLFSLAVLALWIGANALT